MDNAPSIPRMKREIQDSRDELETRTPPASSDDLVDMLDSKLTNFISDLKKTDPQYEKKIRYFKGLLSSGMLPNASATFERKGHRTGGRKTRRRQRHRGGNPPKVVVSSNPAWNLPKPGPKPGPKPNNPAAGTGLFTGGAEAEQKELLDAIKSNKSLAEIQTIVSRGADVNTGVGMQAPPLTWAIHKKRLDLVKFLVENGADVNRQSPLGGLPILEAGDYPVILGYLISHGARYPPGWPMSARTQKIMEKQGAIEVGVKKDLPTPVPSIIKGFLGARRTRRR